LPRGQRRVRRQHEEPVAQLGLCAAVVPIGELLVDADGVLGVLHGKPPPRAPNQRARCRYTNPKRQRGSSPTLRGGVAAESRTVLWWTAGQRVEPAPRQRSPLQ